MCAEHWIGKREIESLEAYKWAWKETRRYFNFYVPIPGVEFKAKDVLDRMTEILKSKRRR